MTRLVSVIVLDTVDIVNIIHPIHFLSSTDPSDAGMQAGSRDQALLERALRYTPLGLRVVVTGGSKGIGRAAVIELAALNARVITCSRNADDLEELLSFCASKGWDVHGVVADVAQQEGRDKLVETVRLSWGGQLDALINVRRNSQIYLNASGSQ